MTQVTGMILAFAILATVGAGATQASTTLREAEVPDGEFSADYRTPTRIPAGIDRVNGMGGVVLFDTEAFAYEWAGRQLPVPIRLDHRTRQQSMAITLPDSFGRRLFLALNSTHGEDIAYSLSVPANVSVLITVQAPCPISCGHSSLSPRREAAETGPVRALRAG